MENKRIYTEDEVVEILERAIRQQESGKSRNQGNGLTLREIEQIGKEVGIDTENIQSAASVLDVTGTSSSGRINPIHSGDFYTEERWIPGRVKRSHIEEMFAGLKEQLGVSSHWWSGNDELKQWGKTDEFIHNQTRIALTDHNTGYRLHISQPSFFNGKSLESVILSFPLAFVIGVLPVGLSIDFLGITWAVLAGSAAYGLSFMIVRRSIEKVISKERNRLKNIANEVGRSLDAAMKSIQSRDQSENAAPVEIREHSNPDEKEGSGNSPARQKN